MTGSAVDALSRGVEVGGMLNMERVKSIIIDYLIIFLSHKFWG